MKLNKKYLTIGVIVVALTWAIGTVNGQDGIEMIEDDFNTIVEIEWEEEPIAVAAGYKDASSLGKKGSKSTTKISKSDRQKFAKLFGFKDVAGLGKVKGETSPVTRAGKKKVAKYFGYKDAAKLDKVKGGTSPVKQSGKKKVAKAFGYKDAATLKSSKKEVIKISKSDHKQLAKMFGFKVNNLKVGVGNVELKLDEKQKKLVAKAFGYRSYHKSWDSHLMRTDGQSLNDAKKRVKFTTSEKKELKKALKLK